MYFYICLIFGRNFAKKKQICREREKNSGLLKDLAHTISCNVQMSFTFFLFSPNFKDLHLYNSLLAQKTSSSQIVTYQYI